MIYSISGSIACSFSGFIAGATPEQRTLRREFVTGVGKEFGLLKAAFFLPFYVMENGRRELLRAARRPGPEPGPCSTLLSRREWLGVGGVIALLASCTTLTGNAATSNVAPTAPVTSTTTFADDIIVTARRVVTGGDLVTRPEMGTYADRRYSFPHLSIEMGPAQPVSVSFDAFIGKGVGSGMLSRYLGVHGEIPTHAVVEPDAQRARMFTLKFREFPEAKAVARSMPDQYAEMYNVQRTKMTLSQYVGAIRQINANAFAAIDWKALCADKRLKLNARRCELLMSLARGITAEGQMAYGLTELFPKDKKHNGVFNAWIMDFGLQNYGREYWDTVPASGDPLASGGPFQFTSYAVGAYKDEQGQGQVGFVTIVSRHSELRVPESFLDFKRTDHELAAFYFAVANYAFLVRDASKNTKALATLERVAKGGHEVDLVAFIATSHHAQNAVRGKFAIPWLKDGAKKPFTTYLRGRFVEYGARTLINFPGLKRYLANPKAAVAAATTKKGKTS